MSEVDNHSPKRMNFKVVRVAGEARKQVVQVLCEAFLTDRYFSRFFVQSERARHEGVAALFAWACEIQFACNMPVLGAVQNGRLVGVVTIQEPYSRISLPLIGRLRLRLRGLFVPLRVGLSAWARICSYTKSVATLRPASPYHYISYIGVLPSAQKSGIRPALLDAARQLVGSSSKGLVLDTYNPEFAERLEAEGWVRNGEVDCGGYMAFSLFRKCGGIGPDNDR